MEAHQSPVLAGSGILLGLAHGRARAPVALTAGLHGDLFALIITQGAATTFERQRDGGLAWRGSRRGRGLRRCPAPIPTRTSPQQQHHDGADYAEIEEKY